MEQEAKSGGLLPAAPAPERAKKAEPKAETKAEPKSFRVVEAVRIGGISGVVTFRAGQIVSDPGYLHMLKEAKVKLEPI